jgi:membrane protease YdiL (CAAX protease family)
VNELVGDADGVDRLGPDGGPLPEAGTRAALRTEVWVVLGVSVGASAVFALISLIGKLTAAVPLSQSQATLNASAAPGRPNLDLAYQLASIGFGVVPALLALYLLGWSALLAAAIGIPGLLLYLAAHALGVSATVVPEDLPAVWWRIPVLVLSAAGNAALEEIVVVGYLLTRFGQLGWGRNAALAGSAVLRGSYHLYQGFGAFVGNAVMGVIFARFYQRTGRVAPLAVAHTLLDTVAFVGYAVLHGRVSWLP